MPGFDDTTSTDHAWVPRVDLQVEDDCVDERAGPIRSLLAAELPREFMGYSTHMEEDGNDPGSLISRPAADGPIRPNVSVSSLRRVVTSILGLSPDEIPDHTRWLTLSQQSLREIVSSSIFHDDFAAWAPLQARYACYPDDVGRYLLGAQAPPMSR